MFLVVKATGCAREDFLHFPILFTFCPQMQGLLNREERRSLPPFPDTDLMLREATGGWKLMAQSTVSTGRAGTSM